MAAGWVPWWPAGMRVSVLTYGGIIQSLEVPDRDGAMANVVLGYDNLDSLSGPQPVLRSHDQRVWRASPGRWTPRSATR